MATVKIKDYNTTHLQVVEEGTRVFFLEKLKDGKHIQVTGNTNTVTLDLQDGSNLRYSITDIVEPDEGNIEPLISKLYDFIHG